ncbi:uncharacterized protein BcabD6B2_02660 [Babesia caballi]|uniref:Transmembrane protein, putative n=1 Tax=Babesia caballi TaxID=5871 RepID=A0AAV4LM03_BABCB|nr:transmembrane protein, putative [Babesia caballi]
MNPYDSEEYQDIHASQWNTSSGGHGGGSLGLDAIAGHPSGYYVAEGRSWSNDGTHSTSRSWYYSVDGSDSDSSLVMPHLPISHEDDRIRRSYFNGQVADVMKRSIWWSVVGVLISELTQLYHTIPLSRIVFNASLICGSLFSDFVAETATMRRLLCSTVLYRMIFWLLLLPACYFFFGTYLHSTALLTSTLMFIVALDGITEALANTSDALYKGVDRLSDQYNMVITPEAHGRMNREYQIVSTWSFVLLVAPLAVLAYGVKRLTNKSDLLVFALVMGGAFLLLSAVSLWCYLRGMPESIHSDQFMQRGGLDISYTTACDEMYSKVADIAEGLLVARSPGYLMRHVIFLAVETAFEHVILSFLIPMIAPQPMLLTSPATDGDQPKSTCRFGAQITLISQVPFAESSVVIAAAPVGLQPSRLPKQDLHALDVHGPRHFLILRLLFLPESCALFFREYGNHEPPAVVQDFRLCGHLRAADRPAADLRRDRLRRPVLRRHRDVPPVAHGGVFLHVAYSLPYINR